MQAAHGDNDTERPMWAEKGGLDFEGRARWDAWTERKGMKPPRAKVLFVQVRPPRTLSPIPHVGGEGWWVSGTCALGRMDRPQGHEAAARQGPVHAGAPCLNPKPYIPCGPVRMGGVSRGACAGRHQTKGLRLSRTRGPTRAGDQRA